MEHRARKAVLGYGTLATLPGEIRLAAEMAAHEAEEIAAIADDLVLPQSVRSRLARLKAGGR